MDHAHGRMLGISSVLAGLLAGCGGGGRGQDCTPAPTPEPRAIVQGSEDGERHPFVGAILHQPAVGSPWALCCSGTLISSGVVMTAAHCKYFKCPGIAAGRVAVAFAPVLTPTTPVATGRWVEHPAYAFPANDVAVVLLDQATTSISPAAVAPEGLLDALLGAGWLPGARLETVGYGITAVTDRDRACGEIVDRAGAGTRRVASGTYLSLSPARLLLDMSAARGNGGSCNGDSGGPHLAAGTALVLSNTHDGDDDCAATDDTLRVDSSSVRGFLAQHAVLPDRVPVCVPGAGTRQVAVADVAAELGGGATLGACP